mgnify:CR=1 FL=1
MIQIQDLNFSYRKKTTLFDGLNLEPETGRIYGLLGKNGAGKTTLLKLVAGLLHPKSGQIRVNGINTNRRHPAHLAAYYMMPEEFMAPAVSVKTFLKINAPFYPDFSREQFFDYLKQFDLQAKGKISRLSYGQKKKFFLSFGLATNAPIFIADEPTNGLDIPSKSIFRKIVASALTDERLFIISTHQVRDIEGLPDTLSVIDDGKIIFNETIDDISRKLLFTVLDEDELERSDVLYSESALGGSECIVKNTDDRFTKPNTELLFNALISKESKVAALFS